MSRIKALLDLQTVDLQRAQLAARLARVEAALADHPAVTAARAEAAKAEAEAEAARRALAATQAERGTLKARLATEERRLYEGQATAPKELQGLHREVGSLRRKLADWDDTALVQMLALDEAAERARRARAALGEAEAAAAAGDADLGHERERLLAAGAKLERVRAQAVAGVAPADLAVYDALRARLNGRVVVMLSDEHCGGCGMHLPRQQLDRVRAGGPPVTCGHCGRVLAG
jgi:predicted  nucleic acid-binding Zn-ribbon protein